MIHSFYLLYTQFFICQPSTDSEQTQTAQYVIYDTPQIIKAVSIDVQ